MSPPPEMAEALGYYTRRREGLLSNKTLRLRRLVDLYTNTVFAEYGDPYKVLADLLEEFGKLYLLRAIRDIQPAVKTAVDFGPGTGWLSHDRATQSTYVEKPGRSFVKYPGTVVSLDLEGASPAIENEIERLTNDTDLSVCSELLHCLRGDNGLRLLENIQSKALLVVEQVVDESKASAIAEQQIALASGQPLLSEVEVEHLLGDAGWTVTHRVSLYHYRIWRCEYVD